MTFGRKAAFRAALARGEGGEPVGIAYGYPLSANTRWWEQLAEPVPDAMRREDGHRTFGLMELAVRAWGYRKVGEARPWDGADLHDVMLLSLR